MLRLSALLEALAPAGLGAHVDMKFATPDTERAARRRSGRRDLVDLLAQRSTPVAAS